MLVQEGCGACAEAEEMLKESISQKKIILLDATSEKGAELVEKYKVETVPTIINKKDEFEQKCFIGKDGDKMFCENGEEKELK